MLREASIVCVSGVSRCCNMDFSKWLYRPLHSHEGAKTVHTFCNLCVPHMNLKDTTSVGDLEAKGPWSCRPAPVKKGREKMATKGRHIGLIFDQFHFISVCTEIERFPLWTKRMFTSVLLPCSSGPFSSKPSLSFPKPMKVQNYYKLL